MSDHTFYVHFDERATFAMGEAFDRVSRDFRAQMSALTREAIAMRIIEDATFGERDSDILYAHAIEIFDVVYSVMFAKAGWVSPFRLRLGSPPKTH